MLENFILQVKYIGLNKTPRNFIPTFIFFNYFLHSTTFWVAVTPQLFSSYFGAIRQHISGITPRPLQALVWSIPDER
jgi:hypothetical protein